MSSSSFDIVSYMVKCGGDMGAEMSSEAKVKIKIEGKIEHSVAEGNGPVNAIDNAIRKALTPYFPRLKDVGLKGFWVKINNGNDGSSASVAVTIISFDKTNNKTWVAEAVSTDIIRASAEALIKSFKNAPFSFKKTPVLDES